MSEIEYRCEAQAMIEPDARERLIGGGHIQLVTLELTNSGYECSDESGEPINRPKVRCELRSEEARLLAHTLLVCADRADLRGFSGQR